MKVEVGMALNTSLYLNIKYIYELVCGMTDKRVHNNKITLL